MNAASTSETAIIERLRGIGISKSYAHELANRKRKPSDVLAIRIFRETGLKLGPIEHAADDDIDALARLRGVQ
jgi:hypothetical protein